jgi:hypothetical protein
MEYALPAIQTLSLDDDKPRVGAEQIAALIDKSVKDTSYLLTHRQLPAYKMANKWHMRPSRWLEWVREQEDATLAEGAERIAQRKPMVRPATVRKTGNATAAKLKRGWRLDGNSEAAAPALAASPK